MNLTLTKSSIDSVERLLKALTEFIDTLKHSKKTLAENVKFCRELRTNRKEFEKEVRKTIKCFHSYTDNQQADIELAFYQALNELKIIVPKVNKEIEDDDLFFAFAYFLKREVNKTLKFFKKSQKKMSDHLYPDRKKEILSNPDLYQKLVDTWGDLAND